MKKLLTAIVLILGLAVSVAGLSACGGNAGEPALQPEDPAQPDYSPYGTYKFYSAEEDGKIWYVGDEIDGIEITEDFWNIVLAPNQTYFTVDKSFSSSDYIDDVSLVCIKEGKEYVFCIDTEKFMTITVSGDTLVGVTTFDASKVTFKKVSDDYTIPEQINPVGGITADTDFDALESDIVNKEQFVNAFNFVAVVMAPYSCITDSFTANVECLDGDRSVFGIFKIDGNKSVAFDNEEVYEYMIFMEEYNSVFECSPDGVFYQEKNPMTMEYERMRNIAEAWWENAVYNKQSKQYEIEYYHNEGAELSNVQIKIKDGKMVFIRYTEDDYYTYCFKFYDIGNTTVELPYAVLQKYQEVLDTKAGNTSTSEGINMGDKINDLFRMYSYFEGNGVIEINNQGYIWYQVNDNGKAECYDFENQVKDYFSYYYMVNEEKAVFYYPLEDDERFGDFNSLSDMDDGAENLFSVSFDSLKSAKFYATAENNVYKCAIGSKTLILTLDDEKRAIKLATEDGGSYIKVERFGGVALTLPQEFIDYIKENTKK